MFEYKISCWRGIGPRARTDRRSNSLRMLMNAGYAASWESQQGLARCYSEWWVGMSRNLPRCIGLIIRCLEPSFPNWGLSGRALPIHPRIPSPFPTKSIVTNPKTIPRA